MRWIEVQQNNTTDAGRKSDAAWIISGLAAAQRLRHRPIRRVLSRVAAVFLLLAPALPVAAQQPAQSAPPAGSAAASGSAAGPGSGSAIPSSPRQPSTPGYLVLIDAAHGGPETGARINVHLLEKDFALSLSVRLRSTLSARGISVMTTRESDTSVALNARAAAANRSHPAACLLLHATTSGTGVHLYTSALPPAPNPVSTRSVSEGISTPTGTLRPWATAQSAFLTQSLKLSSDLRQALALAAIPVTLGSVSLQPIDNMACPAVLLEVSPLLPRRGNSGAALGDPSYETRLVDALGGALEQWRGDWKAQP